MANETTPSTYSTTALSYILGQNALPANLPDLVLHALSNDIDIAGEPSGTKQFAVQSDLGAASAGTYGTQITTNTALSYGSAISGTVVEGALVRGVVLNTAVERRFPGMSGIEQLLQEGSMAQKIAVLQDEVNRLSAMCLETYETDHCLLTSSLSNSVGTTATAFSVNDFLSAVYTYDTLEAVTRERVAFLWPVQIRDLKADLLVNGGGLGGGAWGNVDVAAAAGAAQLPRNGFRDTFMKIPVYQGSHSLRTLSDTNANVNGALIAVGRGDPSKGGQLGAFGHVRSGFLKYHMQYSPADRGMIIVVSLEYVALEMRDSHGVRIKTKAT